ncbi:hypothetical protein OIU76_020972, partial [Salix suchowensis]
MIEFGPPGAC